MRPSPDRGSQQRLPGADKLEGWSGDTGSALIFQPQCGMSVTRPQWSSGVWATRPGLADRKSGWWPGTGSHVQGCLLWTLLTGGGLVGGGAVGVEEPVLAATSLGHQQAHS